jgi:hypothetical protein
MERKNLLRRARALGIEPPPIPARRRKAIPEDAVLPEYLTPAEMADLVGIDRSSIWYAIHAGLLAAVVVPYGRRNCYLIPSDAARRYAPFRHPRRWFRRPGKELETK